MKVVLFCGGFGMRLRDYSQSVPKPMVPIGRRPVLWHVMKYYAAFGHTDFILALGYGGEAIKQFFLEYEEAITNDFVLARGGDRKELLASDIDDWTITFVETGMRTEIGERLRRVRKYVGDDEMFLANYADGLTDLDLNAHIDRFAANDALATFVAVRPPQSYHLVDIDHTDHVTAINPIDEADLRINGGYFVFRNEIFDYIEPNEDLVGPPFHRLLKDHQLAAHRFDGWWHPMDTFKDKRFLDDLWESDDAPWMIWKPDGDTDV